MIIENSDRAERRKSPRFVIHQRVDLVLNDGNNFTVETRNISSSGLQIVCDTWTTNEIEPRGIQSHAASHIHFKIVLQLDLQGNKQKLYANCRVMSVQRLSQDEYMLSLSFIDFDNGSGNILEEYLNQYHQTNVIHKGVVGE